MQKVKVAGGKKWNLDIANFVKVARGTGRMTDGSLWKHRDVHQVCIFDSPAGY